MFAWITTKIKTWIIAALLALGPFLYIFGVFAGRKKDDVEDLKRSAKANEDLADFYKKMAEQEHELEDYNTRRSLLERLRKRGL